jgi:hypothetical protein
MAVVSPSLHPDTGRWYAWSEEPPSTVQTEKEVKDLFAMFGRDLAKEKAAWRRKQKRKQELEEDISANNAQPSDYESAVDAQEVVLGTRQLTEEQAQGFLDWLLPIYKKGDRNRYAMGVAGILLKDGYSLESALGFVEHLCDITTDEEKEGRLDTVRHTYKKTNLDQVAGWSLFDDYQ